MESQESSLGLIEKARGGDRSAFEALVNRYEPALKAMVDESLGAHLRARVAVEDVVQESFLKALQAIGNFQWNGEESFLGWLRGIAQHVILHHARSQAYSQKISIDRGAAPEDVSPSRRAMREERFARLQAALESLNPPEREAILLARIDGLPIKDVASRMRRTPEAVTQLLWRALKKLKDRFGETDSFRLPDRSLQDEVPRNGP